MIKAVNQFFFLQAQKPSEGEKISKWQVEHHMNLREARMKNKGVLFLFKTMGGVILSLEEPPPWLEIKEAGIRYEADVVRPATVFVEAMSVAQNVLGDNLDQLRRVIGELIDNKRLKGSNPILGLAVKQWKLSTELEQGRLSPLFAAVYLFDNRTDSASEGWQELYKLVDPFLDLFAQKAQERSDQWE